MPRRWALTAALVVLAVTVLVAAQWAALPWFLDYFYHLAVVEGFRQSGGLVLHDWWEFAPAGRPHLYPPLWHLLILPLVKAGVAPLVVVRLWCVANFALIGVTLWQVTRKLLDIQTGTWILLLLATPFSLTAAILNYPAASLASFLSLVIWFALEKKRLLAASLSIGLLGYTHTGSFWLFLGTIILYAAIRREIRKVAITSLVFGLLLACPWVIHQASHAGGVHLSARNEGTFLEWAPLLIALAGWGALRCWNPPGPARFAAAWWVGTLPMAIHYRFRLLAGHGLLPTVLLAGMGAADLWRRGRLWRMGLILSLVLWPAWHLDLKGSHWSWADSSIASLAGLQSNIQRVTNQPIYIEKLWDPIALAIQAHTKPDELFACNLDYAGGLLSVLSHRATTRGMLGEVHPVQQQDPIANARLLVWIKETESGRPPQELESVVLKYHLQPLRETQISYLYFNRWPAGRRKITPAVVPWWLAIGTLGLAAGAIAWDLSRSVP